MIIMSLNQLNTVNNEDNTVHKFHYSLNWKTFALLIKTISNVMVKKLVGKSFRIYKNR